MRLSRISILLISVQLFSANLIGQTDTLKHGHEDITLPTINLSINELEGLEESQNISSLLQSSRDVFVSAAGYTFGPARYRMRGYDSENTTVMINGVSVNDMESGRAYWASWGGLNDALRNQDINIGINASELTFGGIGGNTNITTRASTYGKGVKMTYSRANRSYSNRLMFIASTGLMKNGWAFTLSGSRRWAQEGYVEGTFYNAFSYFVSIEKKFNDKHSLGLIGYGSPNKRGRAGVSVQEAYSLAGSNYYNAYWGYQNGEKRNARIGNYHQPMIMLSHYWTMDDKTKLTSTLYYNFGRGGSTALSWVEADDPRPDYYKNLPSYYQFIEDFDGYEERLHAWQNDKSVRQLNWDHFYFANSKFLNTINNVDGIEGNDVTGMRSKYIVEDRRNDKRKFGFNTNFQHQINEKVKLDGGLNMIWFKGYHFKVVEDLLGGDFWFDIDKYADQEPMAITPESQSDLRHPNRLVYEGDKFGYDYNSNINKYEGFVQSEFNLNKFDLYAALDISSTTFWRTGNMQNGKFPEESYGDSEKQNFFNYGAKAGALYKISGRNYLSANAAYMTRAPYFRTAYISPRTRDHVISKLQSEKILSGELNYIIRTPIIKSRVTLYYTEFKDQTWARSFYHDDLNSFVNYLMTGVDKQNAGIEIGIEGNITSELSLRGVLGKGQYIYTSRPNVTIAQDNDSEILAENRKVYLKNYYVGGGPQTIALLGVKYNSPKYWFASLSANYFDDIYIDINPEKHTEEAIAMFFEGDSRIDNVLKQEKLSSAVTLDFFGGKSWKIDDYYISLIISVNNILDKTDFRSGGFEQLRYDPENIYKFPPRYFYLYGRTFFINLSVRI